MTTNTSTRTIYIEPFSEFYLPLRDAIDWTHRLARDKDLTSKWIKSDLKRNIVFKHKSDSNDAKVEQWGQKYANGVNDFYPYQEDLGEQFEQADSVFENPFFAGTYAAKDQDLLHIVGATDGLPYTSCLWEDTWYTSSNTRGDKGDDFEPRLLHWNTSLNGVNSRYFSVQHWLTSQFYNTHIPQALSIDRENINSPNLCYNSAWVSHYDTATGTFDATVGHKGLYDEYYKIHIELLKQNPRLITAFFDLKISDIMDLDFRKLIYLDGVYYRINRVMDYAPHKNQPTKVELIEWKSLGDFDVTNPKHTKPPLGDPLPPTKF